LADSKTPHPLEEEWTQTLRRSHKQGVLKASYKRIMDEIKPDWLDGPLQPLDEWRAKRGITTDEFDYEKQTSRQRFTYSIVHYPSGPDGNPLYRDVVFTLTSTGINDLGSDQHAFTKAIDELNELVGHEFRGELWEGKYDKLAIRFGASEDDWWVPADRWAEFLREDGWIITSDTVSPTQLTW
jgi:hypothetical protein